MARPGAYVLELYTQGNVGNNIIRVDLSPCRCGTIHDGIGIGIDDQAMFVLSFNDLRRMWEGACEARNPHSSLARFKKVGRKEKDGTISDSQE